MKDKQLRKCLGLQNDPYIDYNGGHSLPEMRKQLSVLVYKVSLLLAELGYEYQEKCYERLPRLNKTDNISDKGVITCMDCGKPIAKFFKRQAAPQKVDNKQP